MATDLRELNKNNSSYATMYVKDGELYYKPVKSVDSVKMTFSSSTTWVDIWKGADGKDE